MSLTSGGAPAGAGAQALDGSSGPLGRPRRGGRPIGPWAFTGFAIASFGGPLALAALIAPGTIGGAGASAGLATLVAAVVFTLPLAIWLRYARHVTGSGGLYAFVQAAAGRRVALVQAAIWTISYLLYVIYTSVQIVYDVLPVVVGGERRFQTLLALLIPVGVAAVMIAGRTAALLVIGLIAVSQVAIAGILGGITVAHLSTPISTFGAGAPAGALVKASAQTSLLYICGSLPLFLGGELGAPVRTIRRGLVGAFLLTAALVTLVVAPLAAAPGLTQTDIPGVSVAGQFAGVGLARVIGIGVAVSTAGVILCEYMALTRLAHAVGSWRMRPVAAAIGVIVVFAAPFSLINPDGFYSALVKPSLVALWLSQLIVFVVYPRFAVRHGQRAVVAWMLGAAASAFAIYGLWISL